MAQLPSGTVTFLFTDIEGSTKLLQRLGDDYARVLGEHQALLRAAFAAQGGAEVDTQGDAFFVAFPSAPEAVAAAAQGTRALADHPWPEGTSLRVRMGWAQERGEAETGLRLVAALWRFWEARGHLREGRAWAEGVLGLESGVGAGHADAVVRARALYAGGVLAMWQGDHAAAGTWLEQAETLGRAAGDLRTAARALNVLGVAAYYQGDTEQAAAYFEKSLALMRIVGNQSGIAVALNNLGDAAYYQGDLEQAAVAFTEALALSRQSGDRARIATCLGNLGWVARRRGAVAQAEALGREALALYREVGDLRRCAGGLEHLATTAAVAGHGERAARLLGAAAAQREALGTPQGVREREDTERAVAAAQAALGDEAWAAAFAAGAALPLAEAVSEALGDVD